MCPTIPRSHLPRPQAALRGVEGRVHVLRGHLVGQGVALGVGRLVEAALRRARARQGGAGGEGVRGEATGRSGRRRLLRGRRAALLVRELVPVRPEAIVAPVPGIPPARAVVEPALPYPDGAGPPNMVPGGASSPVYSTPRWTWGPEPWV